MSHEKEIEQLKSGIDEKYGKHFSEESFWEKVSKVFSTVGRDLAEAVCQLYLVFKESSECPFYLKTTVIIAALGYFILPIDVIPDFIPVIGYTDDLAVLMWAVGTVSTYITDDIKQEASEMVDKILGKKQ